MLSRDHKVIYGNGAQGLRTVARDRFARPTVVASATFQINHLPRSDGSADREVQAVGAATIDTASTTTDAACGPGQSFREIPLTSTSGFSENTYYIIQEQSGGGRRELVLCEEIVTNDKILIRHGLTREFASGATVKGCEVSGDFPAAEADDEEEVKRGGGPYAVRWVATMDGVVEDWVEYVWIIRNADLVRVTPQDVYEIDQTLADNLGERMKPEPLILSATKDYRALLQASNKDPEYIHSEVGIRAIIFRAAWYARHGMHDELSERKAETWLNEWKTLTANLTVGQVPYRTIATDPDTDTSDYETSETYTSPTVLS
jgi:hypothetical protein